MSSTRYTGVQNHIGKTPLFRLRKVSDLTGCEILGKAEFMNPGGSVKDRAALEIILDAESQGRLRPGDTIIEGTAGNTGIGLTVVGHAKGYSTVIVIPETQSPEKLSLLRTLAQRSCLFLRSPTAILVTIFGSLNAWPQKTVGSGQTSLTIRRIGTRISTRRARRFGIKRRAKSALLFPQSEPVVRWPAQGCTSKSAGKKLHSYAPTLTAPRCGLGLPMDTPTLKMESLSLKASDKPG